MYSIIQFFLLQESFNKLFIIIIILGDETNCFSLSTSLRMLATRYQKELTHSVILPNFIILFYFRNTKKKNVDTHFSACQYVRDTTCTTASKRFR